MTTTNPDILSFNLEKAASEFCRSELDKVLRQGALQLLINALEAEVAEYLCAHQALADENGRRLVVRNGHAQARTIQSQLGPMQLRAPRVHDRREGQRFTSAILPPYLRKTPSVENLIPTLYLKGISDEQMGEALAAILGEGAAGLLWRSQFCRGNFARLHRGHG
jgi:transposase-like protein